MLTLQPQHLYFNVCMLYCHTYSKSKDQPGKVANPARGQLNRGNSYSLSPFAPENLESRDGFGSPVPHQLAHLQIQAEYGAYLRDSSRVPRRRPFIYLHRHTPSVQSRVNRVTQLRIDGVHWPRVCRHRASKPQDSSKRLLPWQVTMDQLLCASLSHTHCWSEVGMLKVPAS